MTIDSNNLSHILHAPTNIPQESPPTAPAPADAPKLIAYRLYNTRMRIVPAHPPRQWMDDTSQGFAYRCLPLLIANQSGWFVYSNTVVDVSWNGGSLATDLEIETYGDAGEHIAVSHFGHGIVTFHLPFLFRTPPGYNLIVRGPTNWPLEGAVALDGMVETDWSVATFTMNWKILRPKTVVRFPQNYPICMILPHQRGELESFAPEVRDIATDPELRKAYNEWSESRRSFLVDLKATPPDPTKNVWQKHYFQGKSPGGARATDHQTKLELRPFAGQPALAAAKGLNISVGKVDTSPPV